MLNIIDVVALAKAGYKPSDVKELIELSKTSDVKESLTQPPQTVTARRQAKANPTKQRQRKIA